MSTEELSPRQKAAATKRRRTRLWILDAARSLFDEHGYHAVTRGDICREAGMSLATVYNHFPTKQALAIGAYAPHVLGLMQSTEDAITNGAQAEDMIADFIRQLAVGLHAHPVMAYALLPLALDQQTLKGVGNNEPFLDVTFWQVAEFLGKLLERRECAGQYSMPTVEVADFFLSGLLTWIVQHPDRSGEDAASIALARLL